MVSTIKEFVHKLTNQWRLFLSKREQPCASSDPFWVLPQGWYLQGVKAISGKRFKLIYIVLILLVMKQMMYQKEALDVSFILTP